MGRLALDIEEEEIIDSQQDFEIGEHLPGWRGGKILMGGCLVSLMVKLLPRTTLSASPMLQLTLNALSGN